MRSVFSALLLALFVGLLSGCESSEEKAEKHFESALELLEKGDEDRAIIELKNVFKLNGKHKEARVVYAELQRERGNLREAISQNLLIAEQYPDDLESRRRIAELYAQVGNWQEMGRYVEAADNLAPDDPGIDALQLVLSYRNGLDEGDPDALQETVDAAREMLVRLPENIMLRRVVIDHLIRQEDFANALAELDEAIAIAPDDQELYVVRLPVLGALGDTLAVEKQLKEMIERFPEDDASSAALIRWYISQDQLDDAETYLRDAVAKSGGQIDKQLELIGFLDRFRGRDAALAELDRIIASGDAAPALIGLRAGYRFDLGEQDAAIAELRDLLATLDPSEEQRKILLVLAQMLETRGDEAGARELVDQVLEDDPINVEALKKKATWLIREDQAGDAILVLRTALENAPRDPDILTLMARAQGRVGNQELVGEMLSLAYDVSNRAPDEALRYARYLRSRDRLATAEDILVSALRLSPGNVDILTELGAIHVANEDWPRATQVRDTLARLDDGLGIAAANSLTNQILQAQKRTDEAVAFLESLVAEGSASFGANVEIVRSYLTAGQPEKARAYVDSLLEKAPEDVAVLFLDASVDGATGELDRAVEKYRRILQQDDKIVQAWVGLFRVLLRADREPEAEAVVDEALAVLPDEPVLKWVKAGVLENQGDLAGAIAIYEEMYAQDSDNLVIANNLASLISMTSDDPDAINRASKIAQRLRVSQFPPYQDTYGWIAFLRGDFEEALRALEPAAEGMPDDPVVQFHLARAYAAAERPKDAMERFARVLELAGEADQSDYVLTARRELKRLQEAEGANQ